MLWNYLKVTLRNMKRYKLYSIINVIGLAVAMATAIIVFLVIHSELQFEAHHKRASNVYRINKKYTMKGETNINLSTPFPLRAALESEIPEVIHAAHFTKSSCIFKYQDKVFRERGNVYASPEIFDLFTFHFLRGSAQTVFSDPYSMAVSQSIAQKYFGDADPIGKSLLRDSQTPMTIGAVFQDMPATTNYPFEIIQHIDHVASSEEKDDWFSHWLQTFILLEENASPQKVEGKIDQMMKTNLEEQTGAVLQSLKNTHLYSVEGRPTTQKYIYIFASVAVLILFIGGINFMNLATAQASKRAKEIGIRKIIGAQKRSLILQFIGESVIFSLLAFALALCFAEIALPFFEHIYGRNINISLWQPIIFLPMLAMSLVLGICAGAYPAFVLSTFSPSSIFRISLISGRRGVTLRTIIVIVQFTMAVMLIIGTGIIHNQLVYMQTKDLGFDSNNLLVLRLNNDVNDQYEVFRQEAAQIPNLLHTTRSSSLPNQAWSIMRGLTWEGSASDEGSSFAFIAADRNFAQTVGIHLAQGRNFSDELDSDENAVIINQTGIEMMDVENPIGFGLDEHWTVIGVAEDFHSLPMSYPIEPLFILNEPAYFRYLLVRLSGKNMEKTLTNLEKLWKEFCPGFPFEYRFLDETFSDMYSSEIRANSLFRIFASLGIFIACLGLFALVAFLTEQKQVEIGIRKVFGASPESIVWSLSKSFLRWVIVANIIAFPLAWYAMQKWLDGFVYRATISPLLFAATAFISLLIASITIGFKALQAANTDPVKTMKYE